MIESSTRAELTLVRGDLRDGLRLYLRVVEEMRAIKFAGVEPTGIEPWTMTAEAAALMAHVRHGSTTEDAVVRDEMARVAIAKTRTQLVEQPAHLDYPVSGMSLACLSVWLFSSDDLRLRQEGIHLLALVEAFSYNRTFPVMAWSPLAEAADNADPGRLGVLLEEYAGRPGRDLLSESIAALDRVDGCSARREGQTGWGWGPIPVVDGCCFAPQRQDSPAGRGNLHPPTPTPARSSG